MDTAELYPDALETINKWFDEGHVITFFTSGPDTITVPIKIYSMVRFSVTPEVNAASTILLLITLCAAGIALWVHRAKISRIGKL